MGHHMLIALSRHSEREVLVCCLSVLLMFFSFKGYCSSEASKPRRGSLGDHIGVYLRRCIGISLMSYLGES